LRFQTAAFPGDATLEAAVTHALVERVGAGEVPETFRIVAMPPTVSFGRLDSHAEGFPEAVRAVRERGFAPVHRLAGGRAAAYHEGTLVFAWVVGGEDPTRGTHERFGLLGDVVVEALRELGLDAQVGELPGEYCPGTYSVRIGPVKVAGLAQRVTKAASSTEGMIVVSGGDRVRDVLAPVYAALGVAWDPMTAGDCGGPSLEAVAGALRDRLARDHELDPHPQLDPETLALARRYAVRHDARDARPPKRLLSREP
jgi:octanoyl-[GcvH]:protein N-octanoyltransferase